VVILFKINSSSADFEITGTSYSFKTTSKITGKLFDTVGFSTGFDLGGAYSSGNTAFAGSASGTMNWNKNYSYHYPDTFNPYLTDEDGNPDQEAIEASGTAGFGVLGQLKVALAGAFEAQLAESGFTGSISTEVSGDSNLVLMWPKWTFWDSNVESYDASISGSVQLEKKSSGGTISGEDIVLSFEGETETIDFEFTI